VATIDRTVHAARKVEAQRLRDQEGLGNVAIARHFGLSQRTIYGWIGPGSNRKHLNATEKARVRELRYMDGLSSPAVASLFGCSYETVRKIAPGWPGKIDNTRLRDAFIASGVDAAEVARRVGWVLLRGGREDADTSRVRRSLGLLLETGISRTGKRSRFMRTRIDAENAALIAEAIGVAPWSVGCHD
jgi:DNA-binding transcriptional regulator YiaG